MARPPGPRPSRRQPSTGRPRRRARNKTTPTTTRQTSRRRGGPAAMTTGCRSTRTSHAPAQRSSSVPGPRWDLPRTYGPMLPGGGSPDRQRRAVPGGADQAVRHPAGALGTRRRSGHPHHQTQPPGHRGHIRPMSSSPCTPEPARRRKPAELTPVAMPVLKSPGRTARRRQPPILSEPTSWHDRNRAEPDPMRAASRPEGMMATAPESAI